MAKTCSSSNDNVTLSTSMMKTRSRIHQTHKRYETTLSFTLNNILFNALLISWLLWLNWVKKFHYETEMLIKRGAKNFMRFCFHIKKFYFVVFKNKKAHKSLIVKYFNFYSSKFEKYKKSDNNFWFKILRNLIKLFMKILKI